MQKRLRGGRGGGIIFCGEIMRYCVSDLHGKYDLFLKLLDKIKFSDSDALYVCGDIIDKGEDSIKLLKLLLSMPNARCIAGNHEYAFIKYCRSIKKKTAESRGGLLKVLQDYFVSPDGKLLDEAAVRGIKCLPFYIEEQNFICVHAGLPLGRDARIVSPELVEREFIAGDRRFKDPDVLPKDSKCVFFGHTPTRNVCGRDEILAYIRPHSSGRDIADYIKVHLDTRAWFSGVMGCFCIDTCRAEYVRLN